MAGAITTFKQADIQPVTYQANGTSITLSEQVVRNITNNNTYITNGEIELFMQTCMYAKLNPIIKEAYLVKIDNTKPAQMITALGAFMRKADENPNYDGIEDGIIVQDANGNIVDREGCMKYPNDKLIGGWARVYHKNRRIPFVARVSLEEYSKGQATWKQMPSVMINKCAKVSALRKAFPSDFQNLYVSEEMGLEEDVISADSTKHTAQIYNTETVKEAEIQEVKDTTQEVKATIQAENVAEIVTDTPQPQETDEIIEIMYSVYRDNKDKYIAIKDGYDNVKKTIKVKKIS